MTYLYSTNASDDPWPKKSLEAEVRKGLNAYLFCLIKNLSTLLRPIHLLRVPEYTIGLATPRLLEPPTRHNFGTITARSAISSHPIRSQN